MNRWQRFLLFLRLTWRRIFPDPYEHLADARAENRVLRDVLSGGTPDDSEKLDRFMEMAEEWVEARVMAGPGPQFASASVSLREQASEALLHIRERATGQRERLKESQPISAQGAFGDIELALQNVEWRREINLSWLEFSRWGIQQIILISRLYYIKNPLIRCAVNIAAAYVFGRGVEVTTDDDDANEVLKEFFEDNSEVFGQSALVKAERRKYYDGNLFWRFFPDTQNNGRVKCRLVDATEIQEVINNPDDDDDPWLYRRVWVSKEFDIANGQIENVSHQEWYPALGYKPDQKPATIGNYSVNWDTPILHRKCGEVAQWHFGCPISYPALDWAKEARRMLEACATVRRSLAQIALKLTTKGGQQALANAKNQLGTQVNAGAGPLWDGNPTAVNASVFASGPGTTLEAFNTRGAGGDPNDVKWYVAMVAMCHGIPLTWLGELETANLATATTLDRPTELGFLEKQEAWVQDFTLIAKYVLETSKGAVSGRLRESGPRVTSPRRVLKNGRMVYEAVAPQAGVAHVRVNFPAIREGDLPLIVKAITEAMTLDNKGGQVVGIDEKVGVRLLMDVLAGEFDIDGVDDIVDEMYPDKPKGKKGDPDYIPAYEPARTKEPLPPPIGKALPAPGGDPQNPGGNQPGQVNQQNQPGPQTQPVTKTATEAAQRLVEAVVALKARRN